MPWPCARKSAPRCWPAGRTAHKTRAWDCIRKTFEVRNEAITPEVERDLQRRILSAGEFAECRPAPRGRVYIDDAELVLSFFLRNQVKAAVFLSRELP